MSNEVILNLSFDNQTVTDLTGNWTLDGTPNATYEQIEGRDGYSIVEGSLGRCIVLNAVDQNARYDEYTVDFDMFVKSTYSSDYYFYYVFYLWSRTNPDIVGAFEGKIGEVLSISPTIGGSDRYGATNYSPIGRWVHVTITSGPIGEEDLYHTAIYVDGVKLTERTDSGTAHYGNPFGISQRIIPCARDPGSFLMPNGPGVCLNTYKIVAGIHAPNQKPAISLLNLSRVFNNFCTWLKRQLSTVAFTGSYNDLSNKPTISTVNDGTLTIQQNGTNVQTFTANASTNKTANITVPTKTSDLTNDSGFITSDNTKIPLAGSNAISGDLIPATTDAYDLGGSQYQWNNAYIKSLTINGVACGDILTHNTSEFVKVTGNQTIGGIKTFSNDIRISKISPFCNVFSSGYIKGQAPTSNIYAGVRFFDDINSGSTNTITGGFEVEYNRDGYNKSYIASRNYAGENHKFFTVGLRVPNDDTRSIDFLPSVSNTVNLGSPSNKWAKVCSDDVVHTTSNETIDGVKTFTSNMVIQGSRKVTCNLDNSFIELDGGTTWGKGGSIVLSGQERSSYTNSVLIVSKSDTNTDILQYQNGELKPLSNNTNNSSLGTSTNQWASVYAQTYYYNGTEFLNKFVTTDTEQSISQVKEFTRTNSDTLRLKNGRVALGETISSDAYTQFVFRDKNTDNLAYIRDIYFTDGSTTLAFYARNKYANGAPSTTGSVSYAYLGIGVDATGKPSASVRGDFAPYSDETYNLGTSTNKWRDVNTILLNGKTPAYNDDVVPRSGGAVMTDYFFGRSVDTGSLMISGGTSWSSGGSLETFGSGHSSNAGQVRLQPALSDANFKTMNLEPSGTWTWSGTACQITSDQRLKQQISEIDDKLLDAWEDIELVQFKYNESVDTKGKSARLHTGYVVQQIDNACKSHGVDVSAYGLYCHEVYQEETREVEHEDGTKTTEVVRPTSEHYSLRYTEALIVECAYLRKCIKELRTEIEQLKSSK